MTQLDPLSILITQTWQVALLTIVIWFTVRLFAKDRPHLAHALWALVLIKCVTPPLWSSPASPFSWMISERRVTAEVQEIQTPSALRNDIETFSSQRIVVHTSPEPVIKSEVEPNSESLAVARVFTRPQEQAETSKQSLLLDRWPAALVAIWLVGAAICFLFTFVRFIAFIVWIRRSTRREDAEINETVDQLAKQLRIRRRIRLVLLDSPVGPAVLGLFRPTILFPASIAEGRSAKDMKPLLAHEMVHIRRGDLWWALIQTIAKNLFWFHPLVWWAERMVTRESERSCDEETVMCLGCRPATYARGLLDVLEQKHRLRVAPELPGVRPVDITSARLERVMRLGQGSHRRTPLWVWLVMLVSAVLVLPGAALVVAQQPATRLPTAAQIGNVLPQPIPQADDRLAEGEEPQWRVEVHEVGKVLEKMREAEFSEVETMLLGMLGCRTPGPEGKGSTPNGLQVEISTTDGIVSLGDREPTMKLVNETLYAFGDVEQLKSVSDSIERMEAYGFQQLLVETKMITTSRNELRDLGIDWSVATSAASGSVDSALREFDTSFTNSFPALLRDASERNVKATRYVERNEPVLFSVVDEQQKNRVVRALQENVRTNMMSAPKITMLNGQDASIIDGSQRPFVVGLDRVRDEAGELSDALQPVIRVINEGTTLNLNAVAQEDGLINLNCELVFTKIRDVRTEEVPILDADNHASIQVPEVETMRIQSSLDVTNGKTLVLGSLLEHEDGSKNAMLIMLTCHVIDKSYLERQRQQREARENADKISGEFRNTAVELANLHVPAQPAENQNSAYESSVREPDSIRATAYQSEATSNTKAELIFHSEITSQSEASNRILVGALHEMGVELDAKGHLDYSINNDGIEVRGERVTLSVPDSEVDFKISGGKGVVEIKGNDDLQITFAENVKFRFEGIDITAQNVIYSERSMQLSGDVTVHNEEMDLSAERVFIGFQEECVLLEGGAKLDYHPEEGAPTRIHAERIKWNPSTNEIDATSVESIKTGDKE